MRLDRHHEKSKAKQEKKLNHERLKQLALCFDTLRVRVRFCVCVFVRVSSQNQLKHDSRSLRARAPSDIRALLCGT